MNAAEFLTAFPDVKTNVGTGGNCTAWTLDLSPKIYVLITTRDMDAYQPETDDSEAYFGVVNDGEGVEPRLLNWAEAVAWLNGVRDCLDSIKEFAP